MGTRAKVVLCVGLSVASVGVGYGVWGLVLRARGDDDANIGAGIAILLGVSLAGIGAALIGTAIVIGQRAKRRPGQQ